MAAADIDRFRLRCRQFRWLAIFMVCSVGALMALAYVVAPVIAWTRGLMGYPDVLQGTLQYGLPAFCYLFGVWSIGTGVGQIGKGRLIQPTLASTLRRVGLALGVGGVLSVFIVTNLMRVLHMGQGGFLNFDVAGMTLGMIGGALFLLGRVIEQAGKVQAELDEMI